MHKPRIFTYPTIRDTYIVYYFLYMKNLHTILNGNTRIYYEWLDLENYTFINFGKHHSFKNFNRKDNGYLNSNVNNVAALGEDILSRGSFWPFACREMKDPKKREIVFGKHRIYALLTFKKKNPNKYIPQQYLFINIPHLEERKKIVYDHYLTLYFFLEEKTLKLTTNRNELIENCWSSHADTLSATFHKWDLAGHPIIPNPILNDKKLFEEFISTPFDKNNIAYKLFQEIIIKYPTDKPNGDLVGDFKEYFP